MAETPRIENIDERILRILGLEDEPYVESDDYIRALREKMAAGRMSSSSMSSEETELVTNEFKRVRNKGKFKVKKKATINAKNIGGSRIISGQMKPVPKMLTGSFVSPKPPKPEIRESIEKVDYLSRIDETLKSILGSLNSLLSLQKKQYEKQRIGKERERRKERETNLEKIISASKKVIDTVTKPVQGFLSRIFNFLFKALLARAFLKFIDWISDENNRKKLDNVVGFLIDKWPLLIALYLRFGTGIGKLVGVLSKFLIKGGIRLAAAAAGLLAKAGLKKFAGVSKFLGGRGGKLLGAGLQIGATVATTMAVSNTLESIGQPSPEGDVGPEPTPELPVEKYNGGGFAWIKNNFLSSLSMLFGGKKDKSKQTSGFVSGTKGVDKIPAMLSDGEFVVSAGAVKKYGVDTFEAMNAAGGGDNAPKIMSGKVYAAGGGMISKATEAIKSDEALSSLTPGKNDYIRPQGRSVVSNVDWNKIAPSTSLYAYKTGVVGDRATIGWGSTFYDSILSGKKPVRLGDTITKEKADQILNNNIADLAKTYAAKIPYWNKMNESQKAGLLSVGYNAPYGPIGAYSGLTSALSRGDMQGAAENVSRGGPSQHRLQIERKLILSGPSNVKNLVGPAVVGEKKVGSGIPFFPDLSIKRALGMQGGGAIPITESTGRNIEGKGATADRQEISVAVQPGEAKYIIPQGAVANGAIPIIDSLIANLDANSNPAKRGLRNLQINQPRIPSITPYSTDSRGSMMTLPPINLGGESNTPVNPASATEITDFSAICADSLEYREFTRQILGII